LYWVIALLFCSKRSSSTLARASSSGGWKKWLQAVSHAMAPMAMIIP
jgi:hypothetical protein